MLGRPSGPPPSRAAGTRSGPRSSSSPSTTTRERWTTSRTDPEPNACKAGANLGLSCEAWGPCPGQEENGVMRVRISMLAGTLTAGLALAIAGAAQVRTHEPEDFPAAGEITAIGAVAKSPTLEGANDDGGVYVVNDKTTIMSGSKKVA